MRGIRITWHGTPEHMDLATELAVRNIRDELIDRLDRPGDLIHHTIFLGETMHVGPVIHVWGEEGDDAFHCEWDDEIGWVSLEELREEADGGTQGDDD